MLDRALETVQCGASQISALACKAVCMHMRGAVTKMSHLEPNPGKGSLRTLGERNTMQS